jgi:hypothetical protein
MDFKEIERRARDVAREEAIKRVNQLRDQLAQDVGVHGGAWGVPDDFIKAWAPVSFYLTKLLTQRNINAYHHQAEQAAIDKLRQIINAPKD